MQVNEMKIKTHKRHYISIYSKLKFKIPVNENGKPNKSEQSQIVQEIEKQFSIIDNLEKTVDSSLNKTEQLRKSILKSAFEGKLIKPLEVTN